jgi:hypothetical protein
MSKIHVLALAPSRALGAEIVQALAPLDCVVHEGYTGAGVGAIIRETPIDAVVFAGPLPGLSAERILTAVIERVAGALLLVSLPNVAEANAYAQRFRGHAVPFPPPSDVVAKLLAHPATPTVLVARREPRHRFLGGIALDVAGESSPALLVNVSPRGAMVLAGTPLKVGATVRLEVPYGAAVFNFAGVVRHTGENADPAEALSAAPWLRFDQPTLFGVEFVSHSQASAQAFCARLASERALLNLRVTCVPGVPKGLTTVFQRAGIAVETLRNIPEQFDPPPILLVDLSTCSLGEAGRLPDLRRRSVVIGIATSPLTEPARAKIAMQLPGLFVLPFQNESLIRHVEEFFAPIDRKFPRLEEPFTLLVRPRPGETRALEGVNLSLHGCAFVADTAYALGAEIEATLAMDQAIDAYPVRGRIVYCLAEGDRFRVGVNFEVPEPADVSYRKYLSARFLKLLRARWEEQLQTKTV